MRTGIFDLETSSLYANSGIILSMSHKLYLDKKVHSLRADSYKSWKTGKSDNSEMVRNIMIALSQYDILVAHNGQYFDKTFLNSMCLKYRIPPELRQTKFIDPVLIARRHLRLAKNSLASLIDYFDIQDTKTPIRFDYWIKASHDSNSKALSYIVEHCDRDVVALEKVYDIVRKLAKRIDDGGSAW